MLFQGQELLQGGSFNDWQGLDWSKASRFRGITEAYRHLIALRKNDWGNTRGLSGRGFNLIHNDEANKVIAYHRWSTGGPGDDVMVIINFGNREHDTYSLAFPCNGSWQVRFSSKWSGYDKDFRAKTVGSVEVNNNSGSLALPPSTALILSQDF